MSETWDVLAYGVVMRLPFSPSIFTIAIALLGLFSAPARADILYVSNENNTIEKFTSDGVGSVFASSGLVNPQSLAFDSAGNLYVANRDIQTIRKFSPNGVGSNFVTTGISFPTGLAFDFLGNLYVGSSVATIRKFTPAGIRTQFAQEFLDLDDPNGLAFNTSGNLYVVKRDIGNSFNKIKKLNDHSRRDVEHQFFCHGHGRIE